MPCTEYSPEQRRILLDLALDSIRYGLAYGAPLQVDIEAYADEALRALRATFVTLHRDHALRGCIGALTAHRPLAVDVAHNAFAAAFEDPRFTPLKRAELERLELSISVLSTPEPLRFSSETDLIAQLRPGVDGLILSDRGRRGTFLPAVWEQLPEPAQFLTHLKQKAFLPPDHWSDTLKVERYTTESFSNLAQP